MRCLLILHFSVNPIWYHGKLAIKIEVHDPNIHSRLIHSKMIWALAAQEWPTQQARHWFACAGSIWRYVAMRMGPTTCLSQRSIYTLNDGCSRCFFNPKMQQLWLHSRLSWMQVIWHLLVQKSKNEPGIVNDSVNHRKMASYTALSSSSTSISSSVVSSADHSV